MNPTKLLAFGAAGVAAWYFFLRTPSTVTAVAPVPTPAAGAAPTSAGTLDAAFQRMVAKSNGASGSVDDWNSWLMQGSPSITAPDPLPIFKAADATFERSKVLNAAQYWAVMAPVLKSQYGLSGLGLYGSMFRGRR